MPRHGRSTRTERSSELLIGHTLFRFTHSNDRTRIYRDTQPDKVATGAESASGKAQAADNIASEPSAVNIYDIEVVDSKGSRVYSQPYEPTVHFSVIGERAVTWDKYKDRAFKGRDDGMMRAELDASKAKLNDWGAEQRAETRLLNVVEPVRGELSADELKKGRELES